MARRRRSLFVLPVIVFTCSILAGFYGPKVEVASAAAPSEEFDDDVRSFSKVLSLVEANFADKVSADKTVYKGAIPGMLRTLDPALQLLRCARIPVDARGAEGALLRRRHAGGPPTQRARRR